MSSPSRILVTNDDGIDAPGIQALAAAAAHSGAHVVVAAPVREYSGASASMSALQDDGRVLLAARDFDGLPDVTAYAVEASPAFIALIGTRGAFGFSPDFVLSGVNRGANAGHAVLHSGTVGAALTAAETGCRAIAVSLDVLAASSATVSAAEAGVSPEDLAAMVARGEVDRHWDTAARLATGLLKKVNGTPPGTVLNLNVPDVALENVRGVRRAELARFGQVQVIVAQSGKGYVRMALREPDVSSETGTDLALLADGYATVTPLRSPTAADDVIVDLAGVDA
jgi:5'-nucleotidase